VLVKALAYVERLGDAGLADASAKAVLNAKDLASQLNGADGFNAAHRSKAAAYDRMNPEGHRRGSHRIRYQARNARHAGKKTDSLKYPYKPLNRSTG